MPEPLTEYFTLVHRFHHRGANNALVRSVVLGIELPALRNRTGSPRLRRAIDKFLSSQGSEGLVITRT